MNKTRNFHTLQVLGMFGYKQTRTDNNKIYKSLIRYLKPELRKMSN